MTYLHDVFISYRREPIAWTEWTREHFKTLMLAYLQQDLARQPDVFVDDGIEEGSEWPKELARHLATSRVMVAVFSGDYFSSDWCLHELDLMLGRSKLIGNDCRLIIPVVVHDGELIPDEIRVLQPANFYAFRVAYINRATPLYQNFSEAMKALSPKIKRAIDTAPPFDPAWENECRTRFGSLYQESLLGRTITPVHFSPKPLIMPISNPRLAA